MRGYAGDVPRAVIVSAVRTPFGRIGGGLAELPATELGAIAIRAGLERAGVEPAEVGYVVMGQVLQAGAGQAPARQAAIAAGIPKEVPADTINKVCASSIRALEIAELMIAAGRHDVVVTGGMESMSHAPYLLPKARFGYRLGNGEVLDHMVFDGLTSTFDGLHMVEQASAVSRELGITPRGAGRVGAHARTRVPRPRRTRAASTTRSCPSAGSTADESIRRDTTLEKLAALTPVFDPEGTTTAGNAPGVDDGASCVVVCSEEWARERGIEPLARIVGHAYVADEFAYLARTPAGRRGRRSTSAGEAMDDVARVEINEAFASVARNSTRHARRRRGAGSTSTAAPSRSVIRSAPRAAASSATLVHELRRNGGGLGLAAICSGGGQGDAVLVEV